MTIELIMPQELNRLESLADRGGTVSVEAWTLRALLEAYQLYDPDRPGEKAMEKLKKLKDKIEDISRDADDLKDSLDEIVEELDDD